MKNRLLPAFLLVSTAGLFSLGHGQTVNTTPAEPTPQYSPGPVTDYSAALPKSGDDVRFRRGERYNIPYSSLPELGESSEAAIWDLPETHFQKNPMPFDASNVVVVGKVMAGQSYLSNDRRSIYSEFKLKLQDIIKNSNDTYLSVGNSIDIERRGGAVRLPSGKVLVRAALAESMPQIGKRYLLFLKYDRDVDDYSMLTGYQFEGTEVYGLDDLSFRESNHPKVNHSLRKEGISEDEFLRRAKSKLHSPKTGGG